MADITSATSAPNAGLSFLGQYSGITTDVVDQLIEAESGGKTLLQNKVTKYNQEKSAWSEISSALSNFQTKLKALQNNDSYYSKIAKSSNEDLATISGNSDAKNGGDFELLVSQLAKQTKLTGSQVSAAETNSTDLNLNGKLTFAYQGEKTDDSPETVDIDITEKDSLLDIADKINKESKNIGVSAVVINKRLVLTNNKSGAKETTLDQTKNTATLAALGLNTSADLGQAAKYSLDGIDMESDSNVISDAIDGATVTLKKEIKPEDAVTLSLKNDDSKTVKAATDFVTQYNNLMSLIKSNLDVGNPSASTAESSSTNVQGKLVGDSTLQRLQSSLRNMITQADKDNGASLSPFDMGFSVDKDGVLSLDEDKFKSQLADSPEKVHDFFYVQGEDSFDESTDTGYTAKLNNLVNEFISNDATKKGIITNKSDSIDKMVKDLNSQIDDFTARLADKREQYIAQFTQLDSIMMQADSQMQYMQSQLGVDQQ
ncbi:flagellar filament capping protein FliD [Latilactobacillus curvatus]|uniref:Flagellar hook-associated protein 2 n=1 Tax=Latilactobacillus curvatus TaxID=28038 RepID=A0A0B2XAR8_LATCU|nr:flagellar filament capping protein FliD [Latilactobacillus curvatus]AJA33964.1 flagellar hook-associated protein 2 [Latilactobacillus curvatus]KHO11973.1 flagellum hook associated protein FliD [Latilactobacillus curvatus]MCP8860052.1 flagellar filament capping protein FliD [Latilactobacillus curvatus]MCP8861889.1 flagellar filament capping protein FliD [Latilactobacillus curvatus]MCP8869216.1 flagellar filament capping protein FliD [Latilactobacillus curvatus]